MLSLRGEVGCADSLCKVPSEARWTGHRLWVLIANLSQAGGTFLALIVITRTIGIEAAGRFAFAQAIATPLVQLLSFQLKALILTRDADELPVGAAAALRTGTTAIGIALIILLTVVCNPLTGIVFAAKLVESGGELFQADLQRRRLSFRAAWTSGLRSFGLLAALLAAPGLETAIGLYLVFSLALLCLAEMDRPDFSLEFGSPAIGGLLRSGSLLGVVLFLLALQASIPRLLLERESDFAGLGIFATLCVVLQTGNLIVSSYGQGLLPTFASAGYAQTLRIVAAPACVALGLIVPLSAAAGWILEGLHIPNDPSAFDTLLAISVSQVVIWPASVIGYALTARRLYRQQIWIVSLSNVAALIASALLIPRFGSAGAAGALAATGAAMLLGSIYVLTQDTSIHSSLTKLGRHLSVSGANG